jgi:two-component system phosphate regulon sensor histidine kinase PhoR
VSTQTCRKENKTWIGFSVSDSGPGIPPDEQGHLFERFFRGRVSRQSGIPGTGLGLALAREIVGRHNGLIEYQNRPEPEHGATFSIWLAAIGNDV